MSRHAEKTWLVAYDIRCPRRLRKVHRLLRRVGATVQYSAFCVPADDREIEDVLDRVRSLIDTRVDDVRAYHLPARCPVWMLGCQAMPEGIVLDAEKAGRLLTTASASEATSA